VCHWVRDAEFDRERARPALPPSEAPKMRPRRLAGAAAAGLAAVAALAMLLPDSTPADSSPVQAAPLAAALPPTDAGGPHAGVRTSLAPDDPVPATSAGNAAGSECGHDL
jgi:hypothetical protein